MTSLSVPRASSSFFLLLPTLLILIFTYSQYLHPSSSWNNLPFNNIHKVSEELSPNLFSSWASGLETCSQWISAQECTRSYLDAYIIGTQKGGTSELTKRLHTLGVRRHGLDMKKEWHFFNSIDQFGKHKKQSSASPFTSDDIRALRLLHYKSGHPTLDINSMEDLPIVDQSEKEKRMITYDSTVEYLHSDRSAFLSHLLTPHARIIAMIRDPIERAISQYNMIIRTTNERSIEKGVEKLKPTKEGFHKFVQNEIAALHKCGYDEKIARYNGTTSKLLKCILETGKDPRLHVFRGLYSLHINSWRTYFPDHRIHYILFNDILNNPDRVMTDVSKFLCIREFPQGMLDSFKTLASNVSFGQATTIYGKEGVQDKYGVGGQFKYMVDIMPETKDILKDFYSESDRQLRWMLGRKPY